PLTHIEALDLGYSPSHLVVIGGGYVGLEMAQAYLRFGSRVTVVEPGPQILSREDADIAHAVQAALAEEGVSFLTSARVLAVEGHSGTKVTLRLARTEGVQTLEASDILIATGRVPNTAGIGLEKAGVEVDDRGYILVNDHLETTAPEVWAIGECAGSP